MTRIRPYLIAFGIFVLSFTCLERSIAQTGPSLQDINAIKPEPAGQLAHIELRLDELTASLQQATGRMEEMEHELQTLRTQMEKMPTSAAVSPTTEPHAPPQEGTPAPASELEGLSADALYERGRERLISGLHEEARHIFTLFLERFPGHALSANARYWIGDSYALEKNYPAAVQTFMEAYQKDPHGPKAADSLFKVGLSLSRLDKNKEACVTFAKLRKDFPDLEASLGRLVDKETTKLNCGA